MTYDWETKMIFNKVVNRDADHHGTVVPISSAKPHQNFESTVQRYETKQHQTNMKISSPETAVILIVDDNPINLSVLSQTLLNTGWQVRVAVDGENALEQVAYELPDLILLDIEMPLLDGFETCKRLKSNPTTEDIPIIFMTALADTTNKVKGLAAGAVDYITKPFQEEELLARVKVHLKLRFLVQELQQANQKLEHLAHMDGLTGVANRRRFDQYLHQEWRRLAREHEYLSVILCDVDYFKFYNDTYGHQAGDDCLRAVAQAISYAVRRPGDLVARYGGEEFVVILPRTVTSGAIQVAQMLKKEIQNLKIPHQKSAVSQYITVSLGIASQIPDLQSSPKSLVDQADKALYQAKKLGRNQYYVDASLLHVLDDSVI